LGNCQVCLTGPYGPPDGCAIMEEEDIIPGKMILIETIMILLQNEDLFSGEFDFMIYSIKNLYGIKLLIFGKL
jgi:hypothetical protein